MSSSDDTDALPMILAGVILLIMGTAVAMYPSSAGPAVPQSQGARADDSPFALASSPSAGGETSAQRAGMNATAHGADATGVPAL